MSRKAKGGRGRDPFKDPSPYGTYTGAPGNAEQWAGAFKERFSPEEIETYLGDRDPWAILGIEPGAPPAEIKAAYRRRAKQTHPDVNPGKDDREFKAVQAAYETLYRP